MNNSLRTQYLKAIGIQSWQLKIDREPSAGIEPSATGIEPSEGIKPSAGIKPSENVQPSIEKEPIKDQELQSKIQYKEKQAVSEKQLHIVSDSLVQKRQQRNEQHKIIAIKKEYSETIEIASESSIPALSEVAPELTDSIQSCQRCAARKQRFNALPGEGSARAAVFIITEPPNAEEDRSGHYLAGQAELLFYNMLNTIGLADQYFLTGIIKCHSLEHYLVNDQEIINCAPYLYAQLEQINPSVLLVFGATQAQKVLQSKLSFNELRGKIHSADINNKNYPVVISYHPAFLLRNPLCKREALQDLILIKNLLK